MLTPDEVNGYAGLMAAPWDELSERILRDMVRRIVKAGKITSTAAVSYTHLTLPTNSLV